MKTIYIIRHAKSSWTFDLPDIHRPVGIRGRRDIPGIGKYLSENEPTPDLMVSSPASRSLYTALYIGDEWGYPEEAIKISEKLYHADVDTIISTLSALDDDVESVAIFGHNPGFTDLVNHFSSEYLDNLPTCGVCALEVDVKNWKKLNPEKASRKFIINPKKLQHSNH